MTRKSGLPDANGCLPISSPHPALRDKPFLLNCEPMEPEDLPLQVALLTMELAQLRQELWAKEAREEASVSDLSLVKPAF